MKIKIDKPTAEHIRAIISYGLNNYSHGNVLYKAMLCEELLPFADRLHNPWNRKTKTLNVSATVGACLYNVFHVTDDAPTLEPSRLVMLEYVIKPIIQQLKLR